MKKIILILFGYMLMSFMIKNINSKASYYGGIHNGKRTASGEIFNENKLTAAHKTLKFGTKVEVTNTDNNKSVVVKVNDRGPFVKGRDIDLSKGAFKQIASLKSGVIRIKYKVLE